MHSGATGPYDDVDFSFDASHPGGGGNLASRAAGPYDNVDFSFAAAKESEISPPRRKRPRCDGGGGEENQSPKNVRPNPPLPPPKVRPPSIRIPARQNTPPRAAAAPQPLPSPQRPRESSVPLTPAPPPTPSMDPVYLKALSRMAPLGRTGSTTTLCPDMCTLLPPDMRGMTEVAELLWNALVKPAAVYRAYVASVGRLSALHFCIVGAEGSGKRGALRMACASCCVDMLTISPQWYSPDDLGYAVMYACSERPCVIYFDDIDALMRNPAFKHDFDLHVFGQDDLCSTWNRVWLAFGALSEADVHTTPVLKLCGLRVAAVTELQDREAAEMLVNKFLCVGNVRIEPALTDAQWGELAMAARGCTPRDLRDFAGMVTYHALCRISLRNLAEIYGLPIVSETMERQQPGRQHQNRAGFFAAADSNMVASVLGECDNRSPDGRTRTDQRRSATEIGEEGDADSHSGHSGDQGRVLEISWELDAESVYYHIDADSSRDGIERKSIRRPRGSDDGESPSDGNRRRRW